ncbi:MAG: sulfate ABC transporter substrate-binding protein [Polyangiales bacterium]
MGRSPELRALLLSALFLAVGAAACGGRSEPPAGGGGGAQPAQAAPRSVTLTLAAYTTPREAYGEILQAFRRKWAAEHGGQQVEVRESYQGSGAQARAVAGGFPADVVALSLEQDIQKVAEAGLITHDFHRGNAYGGMVTRSVVVLAVRQGNPKGVHGWDDLARDGIEVLTPNVRTSGGAMWNVAALWGAAIRGKTSAAANDPAAAERLLGNVLSHVRIMDRSGRDSMLTFERGTGDVAITYENEVILGRSKGQTYEYVVPSSTIRIDNPVAVVDRNVDRNGTRAVAEAFVAFLVTEEAQRIFARNGYRPVNEAVATATAQQFPAVTDLFTIDDLGGWAGADRTIFAADAAYDRAVTASRGNR